MIRSVFGALGLLLAVVGFVLFVGLVVAAWRVRAEVDRQVGDVAGKAYQAADTADQGVKLVRDALARAEADLSAAQLAGAAAPPPSPMYAMLARGAASNLAGDMTHARQMVGTASDAVVVANAVLDALDEADAAQKVGLSTGRIEAARGGLGSAADDLRKARQALGVDAAMTDEQLSTVRRALDDATKLADQLDAELVRARTKIDTIRTRVNVWTLRAAIGVTVVGGLGALGQVFLFRASWRALRRSSASPA